MAAVRRVPLSGVRKLRVHARDAGDAAGRAPLVSGFVRLGANAERLHSREQRWNLETVGIARRGWRAPTCSGCRAT